MAEYLFVLGRSADLALTELQSFFPTASLVTDGIALVSDDQIDTHERIGELGGTVKIATAVDSIRTLDAESLQPYIDTSGDITFGVSTYGTGLPKNILSELKKRLTATGRHARFIEARHGSDLTSATVAKTRMQELIVVKTTEEFLVGKTVAVQSFELWADHDYGRPYADAKLGMLPPKVARMVVNIAGRFGRKEPFTGTLLDPFCGMGTILSEALLVGWAVGGSDISEDVVKKAQENAQWMIEKFHPAGKLQKLFVSDATHVSETLPTGSVDCIVTEPYMGSTAVANQQVSAGTVKNTIKGLEKLYIGCLRDWHKILKTGGRVMIALPEYAVGGRTYFVKRVIDMCEILGYTTLIGPIAYSRPQAIVRRQFYLLEKK